MDGLSAAVIEIVSPSQLMPSEIHRMCICEIASRSTGSAGSGSGANSTSGWTASWRGAGRGRWRPGRLRIGEDDALPTRQQVGLVRSGPRVIDVGGLLLGLPLDRGTRLRHGGGLRCTSAPALLGPEPP
jgi:hypothetical protein